MAQLSTITYLPPNWKAPRTSRLGTLILKRELSGGLLPTEINPEHVAKKYMASPASMTSKERRFIPLCLLDSRVTNFQPELLRRVATDPSIANRNSFWKKLLRSFVLNYPNDLGLRSEISQMIHARRNMFRQEIINICDNIGILGNQHQQLAAAKRLLERAIPDEATRYMAFSATGKIGGLYAQYLIEIICNQISNEAFNEEQTLKLINLVAPSGDISQGIRPSALVGLVKPMKDQSQQSELVIKILSLVTSNFGDPRLGDNNYPMLPDRLGGQCIHHKILV